MTPPPSFVSSFAPSLPTRQWRHSLAGPPRRANLTPRRWLRACAPTAQRTTDPRGFLLPEEGDVVVYQGRWADEDAAGLVSSVRYIRSRSAHIVDVTEMRRLNNDLFAVPRASAKRNKIARWMDVAEVRVVPDAQYVPSQDAYMVTGTRSGYAPVKSLDAEAQARADGEYVELKATMMRDTLAGGVVGTVLSAVLGGLEAGGAFAAGACASAVYLAMLQGGVDEMGKGGIKEKLSGLRFLIPAVPFLVVAAAEGAFNVGAGGVAGSVSKRDALMLVSGLLTYKVPILVRTGGEFVDGLADFEMGKTGMVGTLIGLAARQIKRRRDGLAQSSSDPELSETKTERVLVFAGPSGAGKSTLIHRLMDEYPGRFDFSVSHTTRAPREDEIDGVDYNFVSESTFREMIEGDAFVEYAQVHGQFYGTSYEAVSKVLAQGAVCILDVDVQGVEAVRKRSGLGWEARFVWVSPPSIAALEERLRGRGTETEETIKRRMDTATREIAFAATNRVFDLTVINADVEEAYRELKEFVSNTVML